MAGEKNYLRLPPDSTGKRLKVKHTIKLQYTGKSLAHDWQIDESYTLSSTGITMIVHDWFEESPTSGFLFAIIDDDNRDGNDEPTVGENISHTADGDVVAQVSASTDIYANQTTVVGRHVENELEIDVTGAAAIRFAEGAPQLDAFGKLRVSNGTVLGDYTFKNNVLPYDFSTRTIFGSIAHNDNLHAAVLTCDAVIANDLGYNLVAHTSNTYHHYYPGNGHLCMMTVALGDTGRNGVTRGWGLFDAENGAGFRSDTAGNELKLFVRTNTTGTVSETVISKNKTEYFIGGVKQSEIPFGFNRDPVDGTGQTKMDLQLTDDNIYWVDLQWLGAGRIRFGTYHRGQRVVIHEHYHEGDLNAGKPTMATGSLPVCFMQKVTVSQATDPVMMGWCAAVHTEATVDLISSGRNSLETLTHTFNPNALENGLEYELIGVISPVNKIGDSNHVNRTIYTPQYFEVLAYHADGSDAIVEVEVYVDPVISGGTESFGLDSIASGGLSSNPRLVTIEPLDPYCSVESYKHSRGLASYWGGGIHSSATYVKGYMRDNVTNMFSNHQESAFKNYAEDGGTRICNVDTITAANPAVLTIQESVHMHREGNEIRFFDVAGTMSTVINDQENGDLPLYMKLTGLNTAELYYDALFTQPVDTTGLTHTQGTGTALGMYGQQMYFAVVVKPMAPSIAKKVADPTQDVTVHFNIGWKEVNQ